MLTRTADEWEEFLQARHVPACRVRTMGEAVADPQLATRGIMHRHTGATGVEGGFGVPVAPFMFAHGGPRIDTPPPALGEHNEEIFAELGYGPAKSRGGVITAGRINSRITANARSGSSPDARRARNSSKRSSRTRCGGRHAAIVSLNSGGDDRIRSPASISDRAIHARKIGAEIHPAPARCSGR